MQAIEFQGVVKKFGPSTSAVNGVNLTINQGEIFVLLGKSGCGKTTLLKMINRLVEPSEGAIFIDGQNSVQIPTLNLRRRVGYVIQHIGLFPHLNVFDNAALVPRLLNWNEDKVKKAVHEWLEVVRLNPAKFGARYPRELSGGEGQRVGVARALVAGQSIILMDEPFGALDPVTREELQEELLGLEDRTHRTVVFVTHDIFEAFHLADRLGLMDEGRLVAVGTPREILDLPTPFVGAFLGRHKKSLEYELKA